MGPRSSTVATSVCSGRTANPSSVSPMSHSPCTPGAASVAWRCRVRPPPRNSPAGSAGWTLCTYAMISSHSSTASAASSASATNGTPAATQASARWTSSSCVSRRAQKLELCSQDQVHIVRPGPASLNASAAASAPSASHASRAPGPSSTGGPVNSGTASSGTSAEAPVRTISFIHRVAPPTCTARSRSVHSGHVGTRAWRSAPASACRSSPVCAVTSSQYRSYERSL